MHRWRALGLVFLASATYCLQSAEANAQGTDSPLSHFLQEVEGTKIHTEGDVMSLVGGHGWTRTDEEFLDVVVRLQFRLATPDAAGAVLVAARPLDEGRIRDRWPSDGYRVALRRVANTKEAIGGLKAYRTPLTVAETHPIAELDDAWHTFELGFVHDRLTVSIDGALVASATGKDSPAGYIGLEGVAGTIEFREMHAERFVDRPRTDLPTVGPSWSGTNPRVVTAVKPRYTLDAKRAKVQGTVTLDGVIRDDGRVGEVWVSRSLRPDLDIEAMSAFRQWRFVPAILNDKATSVVITLELSFDLRD